MKMTDEQAENVEQDEEEELREDETLGQPDQRIETPSDMAKYIITPTNPDKTKNEYHKYITKDIPISLLSQTDIKILQMTYDLVCAFEFVGLKDMAQIYHGDMSLFVNAHRAVGGFERQNLNPSIQTLRKVQEKAQGWFNR